MGNVKTVEKVQHNSTPKGLIGTLFVKWVKGRELLRNSKKFATIADWEPASTVGTRVVYDSEFEEYCVYVYINEKRYFPADHFETDKSEALAAAKRIRSCDSFGVKVTTKKTSPKGKAKAKASPKVTRKARSKKSKAKSTPKVWISKLEIFKDTWPDSPYRGKWTTVVTMSNGDNGETSYASTKREAIEAARNTEGISLYGPQAAKLEVQVAKTGEMKPVCLAKLG